MAIPKAATQSAAPAADPRLVSRTGGAAMRSPPTRDFVLLCSPTEIDFVAGVPLPRLTRFPIEPGLLGVPQIRNEGDEPVWQVAVGVECERNGRILVDPARYGIKPKVSGEPVVLAAGENPADPRAWYVRRYRGHRGTIHVSAWQLPRVLGATVLWEHDTEGEIDFRKQVAEKILGGVDQTIADTVRAAARMELADLASEAKHRPRLTLNVEVARAALGESRKEP